MSPCHRCGTLTDAPLTTPQVRLCVACPQLPICGPWQHEWRGSVPAGTWSCVRCLSTLGSTTISVEPVYVQQPAEDWG